MTISWALLEQYAKGRARMPAGWQLEYEFRPSLVWYPSIHDVHAFWEANNPGKTGFWRLESEEQEKWKEKYLQAKYRRFTGRKHWECAWQRFTLADINGKKIILQMNSQGHVDELKEVEVTQRILVRA